jgi:hypothetical protein
MSGSEWRIVGFTLEIAALSTLLIAPFGLAAAWLLARRRWRGKSFVETAIMLPLVMPPVATGLLLLKFFGRRAVAGQLRFDLIAPGRVPVDERVGRIGRLRAVDDRQRQRDVDHPTHRIAERNSSKCAALIVVDPTTSVAFV